MLRKSMFCAIAQRNVRSPSYERTMIRIPHSGQLFVPGSFTARVFLLSKLNLNVQVIQSLLHKIKPLAAAIFELIEPFEAYC